ncbi:MAG: 3-oxoacyl-[acyl-carrier-protein] reductase [Saprospiraceae bacterium]|nr:3-oxoacyl-[acyl-carrier-protein] reductase [Saprospiraceae bacterium]
MKLLENKVALVTGGARGIGEAIVRRFAEQGAVVAFTYVSENSSAKAQAIVDELVATGATVKAYRSDAANFAEAEALVGDVVKTFGRLDVVVNNAGITRDNLMLRMTEQQWDDVIQTNLKSVFNMTKHALRPMLKQRSGSIINMSSVVGVFGNAGQANYAASKAGIFGFSKSIAKEYGNRNIRCNAIAPGYIETEMTQVLSAEVKDSFLKNIPLGRMGAGEEVADACVFLASDMSRYVSGQTLSVCGALNC